MAKTHGTKELSLPLALTIRLKAMGFLQVEAHDNGVALFRHPKHRELFVTAVTSNIPGDTDTVLAGMAHHKVERLSVDTLCDRLEDQLVKL